MDVVEFGGHDESIVNLIYYYRIIATQVSLIYK